MVRTKLKIILPLCLSVLSVIVPSSASYAARCDSIFNQQDRGESASDASAAGLSYLDDLRRTMGLRILLAPSEGERQSVALGFARKEERERADKMLAARGPKNPNVELISSSKKVFIYGQFEATLSRLYQTLVKQPMRWLGRSLSGREGYIFSPILALTDPLIHRPIRRLTQDWSIGEREPSQFARAVAMGFILFWVESAMTDYSHAIQVEQRQQTSQIALSVDLATNRGTYSQMLALGDPRVASAHQLKSDEEKIRHVQSVVLEWRTYINRAAHLGGIDQVLGLELSRQQVLFGDLPLFAFAAKSQGRTVSELVPNLSQQLRVEKGHLRVSEVQQLMLFRAQHLFMLRVLAMEALFERGFVQDSVRLLNGEGRTAVLKPLFQSHPGLESELGAVASGFQANQIGEADLLAVHRVLWTLIEQELYREQNQVLDLPPEFGLSQTN